jgi:GAF domain-containing protein
MSSPDQSIVRIYNINGLPVGSGILTASNMIITCAHVVQTAVDTTNLGVNVHVDFPLIEKKIKLDSHLIFIDLDKDIACLGIMGSLPMGISPAHLVIADNLWGHPFRAFGFPRGYEGGVWSSGVLRGITGQGWLQIEDIKDTGFNVQPGFSGGLVWDDQLQAVVGMVVAAEMERSIKTAFCIPSRELINLYPALKDVTTLLCPYRSLDVFTENDQDLFFGRENFVNKVISSLKRELRFLAILGPSGSGKSSVIRAGLIPALREGKIPGSERWHVMTIRPGVQPFTQLDNVGLINDLNLEDAISKWFKNNLSTTRLVLFIDQFEELLIVTPVNIRRIFIAEILKILNSSMPVSVIITMRSDFSDRYILEAPQLFYEWHQRGLTPVPPFLDVDDLYAMISTPAQKAGVEFEQGLIDRIIKDAVEINRNGEQAESTILPLLEFSLTQMWEIKKGNLISHNDYQTIGGVSGGLSLWADKAYYGLNEAERKIARRILTDLVNFGDELSHTPNTKRIRQYEEIARTEASSSVLQKLVQARLLVAGYEISLKHNTVEIIHEALIYKWGQLMEWIDKDREYLRIYNHFSDSVKDWERFGKEDGLLYRGARLAGFEDVLEKRKDEVLSTLENEFLQKSKQYHRVLILNEVGSQISSSLDPQEIYAATHRVVERLITFDSFIISILDQEKKEVEDVYQFNRDSHLQYSNFSSEIILRRQVIADGKPLLISSYEPSEENQKQDQSIIAAPMMENGLCLGVISVQSYKTNAYAAEDLHILGEIAEHTLAAIQKGRLFSETQSIASQLESRVAERTIQLQREQQNTETLLRILTEISSSLDLDRALTRSLSLLNNALEAHQSTIMLVHAEDNLLHFRAGYGYVVENRSPDHQGLKLKIGDSLAGWVVKNQESVLINDLHQDPRWIKNPSVGFTHRSSLLVPMLVGEDVIGVLMVFHRNISFFIPEMLNLVKAIGTQIAVAINNARLYELIRDQAERLGLMLRKEQIEAIRSQAILESVADGVLVTGSKNQISFVNLSALKMFRIDENLLLGKEIDVFVDIIGATSVNQWIKLMQQWKDNPSSDKTNGVISEQWKLRNGKTILVHVAPVIYQNDYLGTVSTLRDITDDSLSRIGDMSN